MHREAFRFQSLSERTFDGCPLGVLVDQGNNVSLAKRNMHISSSLPISTLEIPPSFMNDRGAATATKPLQRLCRRDTPLPHVRDTLENIRLLISGHSISRVIENIETVGDSLKIIESTPFLVKPFRQCRRVSGPGETLKFQSEAYLDSLAASVSLSFSFASFVPPD